MTGKAGWVARGEIEMDDMYVLTTIVLGSDNLYKIKFKLLHGTFNKEKYNVVL